MVQGCLYIARRIRRRVIGLHQGKDLAVNAGIKDLHVREIGHVVGPLHFQVLLYLGVQYTFIQYIGFILVIGHSICLSVVQS